MSSPGALPAKTGSAPGESGFTVTVFLPVQLSGLTLSHRSSGTAQVDLQKSKNEVVADGNDSATMTATVRDAKGNLLNDVKVTFNVNSAEAKLSQTEVNSHDGIATATLTSLKNGDYRVTDSVSSGSQANQQVNFIGDQSTAALTLSVPSGDITVTNTAP